MDFQPNCFSGSYVKRELWIAELIYLMAFSIAPRSHRFRLLSPPTDWAASNSSWNSKRNSRILLASSGSSWTWIPLLLLGCIDCYLRDHLWDHLRPTEETSRSELCLWIPAQMCFKKRGRRSLRVPKGFGGHQLIAMARSVRIIAWLVQDNFQCTQHDMMQKLQ